MFKRALVSLESLASSASPFKLTTCANESSRTLLSTKDSFPGLFRYEQLISLHSFQPVEQAWSHEPNKLAIRTLGKLRCSLSASQLESGRWQAQSYSTQTYKKAQAHFISTQASQQAQQRTRLQKRSTDQGLYLVALVIGMVGVTYASVPLYRMFCQATGYGGTVQQGSTVEEKLRQRAEEQNADLESAAAAREITVSFNADVTDGMNWRFLPTQRAVKVHPGQSTLAFYTAHNLSDKSVTGVSTYNVSPQQAGAYFNKIQCFCFEEQKLRPGEKIDMPVFFYIDPEFALDKRMKGIDHLTLSYTFFKVAEEDEEEEQEQPSMPAQVVLPQAAVAS